MNFKNVAFLGMALTLFGCPGDEPTSTAPVDTAPTGEPTPTPAPDPTFDVTLVDGPGADDGSNDGDQLILTITNPPAGDWFFGYAQTQVGATGWFDESCAADAPHCHAIPAAVDVGGTPTSTLTLDRVSTPTEIVDTGTAQTMLLPVDNPPSATPDNTFYIGDQAGTGNCMVFGHDVSYYASLGCTDISATATTNN